MQQIYKLQNSISKYTFSLVLIHFQKMEVFKNERTKLYYRTFAVFWPRVIRLLCAFQSFLFNSF